MSSILFNNISKYYGHKNQTCAINSVNLEISSGEFVVFVGPSGCGKSSLLRMVAGLEAISKGEIRIDNKVVNSLSPAQRDIAMVFQNYALYPHMNVFNNIAYGLKIAKLPKDEIKKRVYEIAEILKIQQYLERKPRYLSGGQRQRVAMGRAMVRNPKVFLFDEPLSNLDAKLRMQTRQEIQKLHLKMQVTSIFVTHDQVEAMALAERIVVLNQGAVEQFDTPENIYANPATAFVAGFIGSPAMNLLDAVPNAHSDYITGVRPEHLMWVQSDGWEVSVTNVENLGGESLIYATFKNIAEDIILRVHSIDKALPRIGDVIYVRPKESLLCHFDKKSGKRVY